jgi:hypothetical protein
MDDAVPDMRELGRKVSNWGRWGAADERGTTNLITPERLVAAGNLIRKGAVFDLGIPLDSDGPQPGGARINPSPWSARTTGPWRCCPASGTARCSSSTWSSSATWA